MVLPTRSAGSSTPGAMRCKGLMLVCGLLCLLDEQAAAMAATYRSAALMTCLVPLGGR